MSNLYNVREASELATREGGTNVPNAWTYKAIEAGEVEVVQEDPIRLDDKGIKSLIRARKKWEKTHTPRVIERRRPNRKKRTNGKARRKNNQAEVIVRLKDGSTVNRVLTGDQALEVIQLVFTL